MGGRRAGWETPKGQIQAIRRALEDTGEVLGSTVGELLEAVQLRIVSEHVGDELTLRPEWRDGPSLRVADDA